MVLETSATAGSSSRTLTTRFCRSAMASKLMSGLARVKPCSKPVSWIGIKPFGTTPYSLIVAISTATVISSMVLFQRSATVRLRP